MMEQEKNHPFVHKYKGILFPEDLLFKRKNPYISRLLPYDKPDKTQSASMSSQDAISIDISKSKKESSKTSDLVAK